MANPKPNKLADLLSTWFGCGYVPVAPGTAGSLAAIALVAVLRKTARLDPRHFAILVAAGFPPAVWAATLTARRLKQKDPGVVVIDEVLGQWIALAGAHQLNWKTYAAAFLLFRFLDILKPPPARELERLPEGLGIIADDLMAGGYAALLLSIAGRLNLL